MDKSGQTAPEHLVVRETGVRGQKGAPFVGLREFRELKISSPESESPPFSSSLLFHFSRSSSQVIAVLQSLSTLPIELLLYIFSTFLDHSSLSHLSLVSPLFRLLAQPLLYSQPCTSTVEQLELLIDAVTKRKELANEVRELTVLGRVFQSKGYGIRIQRLLKQCQGVRRLELVGIDDLRPKHLISQNRALTHLSLLNSSFRPHSLVDPPNLSSFVSGLTHLTLSNLGLPPPSTHLSIILSHASRTIRYLAISSIRDVELVEFRKIFTILSQDCSKLSTLVLGFLTDEQVSALCLPSLSSDSPYPVLSQLSALKSLTFTLPHPSLSLLLSIPPTLETLTIRPPYSRSSSSRPLIGHSKNSLLAVLNPVPSPSTTSTNGSNTPTTPIQSSLGPESGLSGSGMGRRRTRSIPLELLEEEELILSSLSLALLPNPPKLVRTQYDGGPKEEVEVLRKGQWLVAETGLREVGWECKGLRGGKERVKKVMRERQRVKEKKEKWLATSAGGGI
ncbi:uncharacterized protein JCM6883_002900 [Sporobolomyces salmoneus]|uniref:uncharacterized protein n=1 Tax=Sporobolomyces salmoneus TaxID=183962 RepID=UPI003177C9DE